LADQLHSRARRHHQIQCQQGLHSARAAVDSGSLSVDEAHVKIGIDGALQAVLQSIKQECHTATYSPNKGALFEKVLLACALAQINRQGYFRPSDVVGPLNLLTGETHYGVPHFARHLGEFEKDERGPTLVKTGRSRAYVYRFKHPLMQPYVIMKAIADGTITHAMLEGQS